jgi:hypothetical protein
MWKFVARHELYLGIFILLFSAIWMTVFLGHYNWYIITPVGISWTGLICLFDFFDKKYFSHTIVPDTGPRERNMFLISIVSILFCVLLETFGVFIGRLWYYPFWSIEIYLILAPFAFIAYTLLLFVLYEFVRDVITRYKKISFGFRPERKFYGSVMDVELILGIIGYYFSIKRALQFLSSPKLSSFVINQKGEVPFSAFLISAVVLVSTFFIFEFICYKQNKQTLTHDILSGNLWPIIFIMAANVIAIIVIEFANGPFQMWSFSNWPFDDIRILHVPVVALLWWPLQFPAFLSMLRAVFPSKKVVW